MNVKPWRHGTPCGYTKHHCRCTPCRAANAAHKRAWLERRRVRLIASAERINSEGLDAIRTNTGWLCVGCWHSYEGRAITNHERSCLEPHTTDTARSVA